MRSRRRRTELLSSCARDGDRLGENTVVALPMSIATLRRLTGNTSDRSRMRHPHRPHLELRHLPPQLAKISVMSPRSEEHTSELQSHVNLVCRLLLEKKNIQ